MSFKSFLPSVGLLFGCFFAVSASAVLLEYDLVSQSGSHYELSYSLTNETSDYDVDWFAIFFEADSYQDLQITTSPATWDPLVAQPDPFFGDGYADWFSDSSPVAVGDTVTGFNVAFDWIGASDGPFDGQDFEVYDVFTLDLIASGRTAFAGGTSTEPPVGVSEPSSIIMTLSGVIMLLFRIRKQWH